MSRVLVTGGLGYIGSHTTIQLIENGFEVVIIDNLSNTSIENLKRIEKITDKRLNFYKIDLRDYEELNKIFEKEEIDSVIHFAAKIYVEESSKKPIEYYDNNINSLITLLKVMKKHKVYNFIFSSSCTVYGDADKIPVTEQTPITEAKSVYGDTKIISEQIIKNISNHTNLKAVILRYFNPVGAHHSGEIGEPKGNKNKRVFQIISDKINNNSDSLVIFGNDYNTKDGTCIRDYIHISDLADSHVKALIYLQNSNTKLDVFNIGTGNGYTVLEIIKEFEKTINKEVKYKIADRRFGDIEKIYADNSKAQKILNWEAKYDLSDMIKTTLRWEANNN